MNSHVFAEFCRKERRRRNMTLADQSELMNMTPLRISQIESGEDLLTQEYIIRVCSFFEIDSNETRILLGQCKALSNVIELKSKRKLKLYQLTIDQIKALSPLNGGTA